MGTPALVRLPENLRHRLLKLAAVMYWFGALAVLATLLPRIAPEAVDRPLLLGCVLMGVALGFAAWKLPWHRWPANVTLLLSGGTIALIALVLLASGGPAASYFALLVLPVLFAATYYGGRVALAATVAAIAAGGIALLPGGGEGGVRAFIMLATVLGLAAAFQRLLVRALQKESGEKEALYQLAEKRRGELESSYLATLRALAAALDAKDRHTEAHGRETAALCVAVGRRLGCAGEELRSLEYGALLHDLGKIGIPGGILNKPGPLTAEEFAMIREHPVIGERILATVPFLAPVLPLVRGEHERYDGSGYPDGLKGEEIPLGARIIFACDAFDAMSRDRPYRRALPREQALAELRANAGKQFDAKVVEALIVVVTEGQVPAPPPVAAPLPWASGAGTGPGSWAQHLDSIQALGIRLSRINRVQEIAQQIGETIIRLMEYDQCRIWVANNEELVPAYASTSSRPEYRELNISSFHVGEGIVGWVAQSRQGVVIGDARRHPRRRRPNPFDESVLAVPVVFGDELLGVIAVVKVGLDQYERDQLRLLTILANQAAVSIANARMYERLAAEATTDPLTGLLNRRAMQQRIHQAVAEEASGFALFLADIDQLKTINDRFGHLAGDQALLAVAECARGQQIEVSAWARWGGDEFLALLPGASLEQAEQFGRSLRAALATFPLPSAPTQRVSISFGVAHCPTDGTEVAALLYAADRAMYGAKRARPGSYSRAAGI